jgi:hypothetical protein
MHKSKTKLTKRAVVLALTVAVVLLAFSQVALAGSSSANTFTVNEVNKAGATTQVGTWTYDATNQALVNSGVPAPFVQPLVSTDYLGNALPYLPFSGQDAYSTNTKMAVAMKGFYIDDLAAWVAAQNGVPLGGATAFNVSTADNPGVNYYTADLTLTGVDDRYWYPSYNLSADPATATWDDATRMPRKAVLAIVGNSARRQAASPANPTTYTDLLTALGNLATTGAAYDTNRLQLWMGQTKGGYTDLNLGSMSPKYVDSLTFTPAYKTITTNVVGGAATVVTDDGYLKATAGEPVSFKVSNVASGFEVSAVTVWDADGQAVAVNLSNDTYSFTMPASAATINVTLSGAVDIASASVTKIRNQVFTGSRIKPQLTVTYGGATLTAGVDYTVAYTSNRLLGTAKATVTGIGMYYGTKSMTFLIVPQKTKLRRVSAGQGKATVTWQKPRNATGVTGFEVDYRAHGSSTYMSAGTTRRIHKIVRYLSPGKTYDFRVRTFTRIHGTKYYGSWSRTLTATIK